MITRMTSPSPSPTSPMLKIPGPLRRILPAQPRKWLPVYLACLFTVLFLHMSNFQTSSEPASVPAPPAPIVQFPPTKEPARTRSDFPHKIWQEWKMSPLFFKDRDLDMARTWVDKNPGYRYEVLTDKNEMSFIEYHYGSEGFDRPDIIEFYRNVNASIVRADMLRYLIMYAEGGVYADIDVQALRPISRFVPERFNVRDVDMIVGVEIDEPDWRDHPILGPKSQSFCQWTFVCKPRLPVMMRLIEHIMTWMTELAKKQKLPISEVALDFDDIITGTGPSAFTDAIIDEINKRRGPDQRPVTWDDFHDMAESKLVGGVLALTIEAFAAGQGHSDSGDHDSRAALVQHHYHASGWPDRHPRYSHPAYGMVEDCNWKDECVHAWDANVAAFEELSQAEQHRVIAKMQTERHAQKKEDERRAAEERGKAEQDKKAEEAENERQKQQAEGAVTTTDARR